jgi:hypothetical protein
VSTGAYQYCDSEKVGSALEVDVAERVLGKREGLFMERRGRRRKRRKRRKRTRRRRKAPKDRTDRPPRAVQ